jgi:formiminoglutamate deiminase
MAGQPEAGRTWHADLAWLGGERVAERVTIACLGDRITAVIPDSDPPPNAVRLRGLTLPGLANPHSHALHRALRGRTQTSAGDFWTWRERMYELVERLDPDSYYRLARATYAEMALAGVTAVGEFHYLHHAAGGVPYDEPNAKGDALIRAASDAGIRITLIDACYLWGGLGRKPLSSAQRRFGDATAERWARRVDALAGSPTTRVAAAIHSVRAVDAASMPVVRDWARANGAPLHVHASEQVRENEACLAVTGLTPVGLLAEAGVLGPSSTVIHATHVTDADIATLGSSAAQVCLCPTTARDLGDGVGPARALASAGCSLTVASDMHAVIDPFEEVRALELDERLVTRRRGLHAPAELLGMATVAGMRAIGWDATGIAEGGQADLVAVRMDSARTAGADRSTALAQAVFAASAADVTNVVVAGRPVVVEGRHVSIADVGSELAAAIAPLTGAPEPMPAAATPMGGDR